MLSPNSWLDTILSVLEWGRCILQVEGMWTIMTRGKDSSLQALTVSLPTVCMPLCVWSCCSSHQWVFTSFLNTACILHLIICFVQASMVVCFWVCLNRPCSFHSYWLLPCEQAQDILFDLRYSEASEIMKRWREGPSYLSNYSNSNQTHDWAGIPPTDCKCMNGPSRHHVMQKNFPYELSQRPMGIMEWVSSHCLMS